MFLFLINGLQKCYIDLGWNFLGALNTCVFMMCQKA